MASKINDSMEWLHIKEVKRLVLIGKLKLTKKQKKEIDDSIKKLEEAEIKKKKEEERCSNLGPDPMIRIKFHD